MAGALIPLAQAMFANGDLGPARDACTRALKILQVSFGQTPRIEVRARRQDDFMVMMPDSYELSP